METGVWRRELGEPGIGRGGTRSGVARAFVGSRIVLEGRREIGMREDGGRIVPRGPIMIVDQVGAKGWIVSIEVGSKRVSLGVSRGEGGDPTAFFGGDVDECVEAEEGGAWGRGGVVRGRDGEGGRVGCGARRGVGEGAVEEGEEGGGLGVEEGVYGAGSIGVAGSVVGRGRVAEEGGDVHASWGHGSKRKNGNTQTHRLQNMYNETLRWNPHERPSKRPSNGDTAPKSHPSLSAVQRSQCPRPPRPEGGRSSSRCFCGLQRA